MTTTATTSTGITDQAPDKSSSSVATPSVSPTQSQSRSPSLPESQSQAQPKASTSSLAQSAIDFAQQAEKLSKGRNGTDGEHADVAVEAQFVTPQDPVILTSGGNRLPGVPLMEAHKLNILKEELEEGPKAVEIKEGQEPTEEVGHLDSQDSRDEANPGNREEAGSQRGHEDNTAQKEAFSEKEILNIPTHSNGKALQKSQDASLRRQLPPSHTNPLFPPLPLYGPPSLLRDMQCGLFRLSSFFLSLAFLAVIVLGALFTSVPLFLRKVWFKVTFRSLDATRPFYEEEKRRAAARKEMDRAWSHGKSTDRLVPTDRNGAADEYIPTEGGPDPVVCDVGYYARRVGLDVEEFHVQTEDGFVIDLWHVFDPKEYTKLTDEERQSRGPDLFTDSGKRLRDDNEDPAAPGQKKKPKFPVLLMHGLLQSAGAYCVNDDDSLAFYLCKSGFDVWLGNNRCGFSPKHVLLEPSDPRMWCWNIRQMGVFDLPALTARVLHETGFDKIGLICHSQGTTETLVALAKEQRPDLGQKLTVFCALAPACYAGPLIGKAYFKFMRVITPAMFRLVFGIHAFIPQMMTWYSILPARIYGWLGYKVFSFLFDWSDIRWDRGLRDRMFQFAPVYVSAESMRWWLGRECFAKHKCVLATKESVRAEEREDARHLKDPGAGEPGEQAEEEAKERVHSLPAGEAAAAAGEGEPPSERGAREQMRKPHGATAWYNEQAPPFALWVAGNDDLVDGRKLLRRFERGREPHVRVVHSKVIQDYEHLDVIWAMDAPEQVFCEVREVLWKTCDVRELCRTPAGCDDVAPWKPKDKGSEGTEIVSSSNSSGSE